jgi:DNA-binding PucR family transcriptional regulator
VFVLVAYTDEEIDIFVKDFFESVRREKSESLIHMGISSNQPGIYNQEQNFERSFSAMEMAQKQNENVLYYDKLSIYKILYAVKERSVLRSFYNDSIGLLEKYDRENKTDLVSLLKTYLENNGSLQLVSEKMYIHRNTVTNQLKRIETITGFNPLELEDKVKLYLGFYIRDII